MVLDDVADGAGLVVEGSASLNAEVFGHGDLHALHVVAIPHLFHERIREPKRDHVADRALGEIVIDAKDVGFIEGGVQDAVELLGRSQIVAEGLFDDDARALGGAGFYELLDHLLKEKGRDGKVVRGMLRRGKSFPKRLKGGKVGVVTVYVAEQGAQLRPCVGIEAAMLLQAVFGARFELVEVPAGLGDTNDRERRACRAGP